VTAALATTATTSRRELDDVTFARAQQGDDAAFRALVETYQHAVFALLWRVLGRAAQAAVVEDLAQITFLGVYRGLPRFRPRGAAKLSTWILTIAARTALKERRYSAQTSVDLDDIADGTPSPQQRLDDRAFADAVARSLDALDPGYRAVFVLRAYHDFDYQDIADALELDLGTVKSRLSRARGKLRDVLEEFAP
jgi:RNA polymerase sigma-70 factor (ECF subfamily)